MEIHKPKPIHNWREFLKEYAIIVLGVATALIAEQAVEWLHWQHRVNDAVEAIQLELRDDNGPEVYARIAASACFDRQLDAIQTAIEAGRSRAEIIELGRQYTPPNFVWDRNAWDTMLASDIASHVSPDRMIKWGFVYSVIPLANEMAQRERDSLAALDPIRRNGDRLSASEADTMLSAVARLRTINHGFGSGGPAFLGNMERAGITLTPERKNRILSELRARYADCVIVPSTAGFDPSDDLASSRRAPKPGVKP